MTRRKTYTECIREIKEAFGYDISEDEILRMAESLETRYKQIKKERQGITADQAINQALNEVQEQELQLTKITQRATYLSTSAFMRELQVIRAHWNDSPSDGIEALYAGNNYARSGSRDSIDAQQKSLASEWVNGFFYDISSLNNFDILKSGELDDQIAEALHAMYSGFQTPEQRQRISPEASRAAEVIFKWNEQSRLAINSAGGWAGKRLDYIFHQSHDRWKIRKALYRVNKNLSDRFNSDFEQNFNAWVKFVTPLLSTETFKNVPEGRETAFLKQIYQNLYDGVHLKYVHPTKVTVTGGTPIPRSIAQSLSAPRVLHFKDAKSRMAYHREFGRGNTIIESVYGILDHVAHKVALMQRLGPNPYYNHLRLMKAVEQLAQQNRTQRLRYMAKKKSLEALFSELDGTAHIVGADNISTALRFTRAVQNLSKLGGAVISALADTATGASELHYQGMGVLDAWYAQVKGTGSVFVPRSREQYEYASALGVGLDFLRGGVWSRFTARDQLPGIMSRLVSFFFKVSGLTRWTDSHRLAAGMMMSHFMGMKAETNFDDLPADFGRMLKLFQIGEDEWNMMRKVSTEMVNGKVYFDPRGAEKLTDAQLAILVTKDGHHITDRRLREKRQNIQRKFRSFFADRADYAVLTPDAKTNTLVSGSRFGLEPGGVLSEVFKSFMNLKTFPFMVLGKTWGRQMFGYTDEIKTSVMEQMGQFNPYRNPQGVQGLMMYIAASTFLGYFVIQLKQILKGQEPRPVPDNFPDFLKQFTASMVQGGGAGIMGDFLFGQATKNRFGQSPLITLAGPSVGAVDDILKLYGKVKDWDADTADAFRIIKSHTPFVNLWWLSWALNYGILYNLQEQLSPGSLKKMEKLIKEETGSDFLYPPSEIFQ